MVTRRDVASIVGLGAIGAATAGALATPALAQAADTNESTFARIRRTKKMRIGAVGGGAPYYMKDLSTGQWKGFYVDIAKALAEDMEAELEITETTWGNSVLDLQSNKIDAMFGLAPSPQRAAMVNFADTLFENTYTVVCKKGVPQKSWEQLNTPETKIVVDIGSSHDQLAQRVLPKADVTRLENSGAATMSLQAGRADCQVLVILLAEPLLAKRPGLGTMYIPQPVYTAPVSIGLRKDSDPGLQKAVNAWLAQERSKGAVRSVILKNMEKLAGVPASAFPPEIKF